MPDSIAGTYSIDGGTPVQFDLVTHGSANDNVYHTSAIPLPDIGSHSVSIVYTVTNTNPNGGNGFYGTQLFRSPPLNPPTPPTPFVVAGVVPEPASLGLLGLGGVSLLVRRRREQAPGDDPTIFAGVVPESAWLGLLAVGGIVLLSRCRSRA